MANRLLKEVGPGLVTYTDKITETSTEVNVDGQLSTTETIKTPLKSIDSGEAHQMVSGAIEMVWRDLVENQTRAVSWTEIKDQFDGANIGASGIKQQDTKSYNEDRQTVNLNGDTVDLGGTPVQSGVVTNLAFNSASFGFDWYPSDAIISADIITVNFYKGTDNTGVKLFTETFTGITASADVLLQTQYSNPLFRLANQDYFTETLKNGVAVFRRPTVEQPTNAFITLYYRDYLVKSLKFDRPITVTADRDHTNYAEYLMDVSGGSLTVTVHFSTTDPITAPFYISDATSSVTGSNKMIIQVNGPGDVSLYTVEFITKDSSYYVFWNAATGFFNYRREGFGETFVIDGSPSVLDGDQTIVAVETLPSNNAVLSLASSGISQANDNIIVDGTGSSLLELSSASKGFLMPRMTTAEKLNISAPATGLEVFDITLNRPEFFDGSVWGLPPLPSETLAATLAVGKTTGGNDIVISNGDKITSPNNANGIPITIEPSGGSNAGGDLNLLGGDSSFGDGGNVNIIGGNGPEIQGGDVNITGGIANGSDGIGGDVTIAAGRGGTSSGPGGILTIVSGNAGNSDEFSGNVDIRTAPGGVSGGQGVLLLQKDGGRVGIGNANPSSELDVTGKIIGDAVQVGTTADKISLDHTGTEAFLTNTTGDMTLDNFGTTSDLIARIGSDTPNARFVVKNSSDVVKFSVDGTGVGLLNGKIISKVATTTVEVFTAANIDDLATAGVITVATGTQLTLIIKGGLVSSATRFVLEGTAGLDIIGNDCSQVLLYSGTGTYISGSTISVCLDKIIIVSISTGTFVSLTGGFLIINNCIIDDFDDLGSATSGIALIVRATSILNFETGLTTADGAINLSTSEIVAPNLVGNVFDRLPGITGSNLIIFGNTITIPVSNSLFRIDPAILEASRTSISGNTILSGQLFDTSGGITGTFADVFDVTVPLTEITSVTNVGGIAQFNFTVGPTLFVDQKVDMVNFVTQTNYNQSGIITTVGSGFYQISSIAFTADDATGDFTSDSVQLFETATALNDGDTLVIDTDDGTEYDGGGTVYGKDTNTFRINRVFDITASGTWDTAGIDQKDPRVLATNNPGFIGSKYIAAAHVNNNAESTSIPASNTFNDIVFGTVGNAIVFGSTMERFKLVDEINCILEYTGNEPFDDTLPWHFTATSSGGAVNFRYKWALDTGSGFVDFADDRESLVEVGSTASSTGSSQPMILKKGDKIKPQITRNTGTSTIIISYATIG